MSDTATRYVCYTDEKGNHSMQPDPIGAWVHYYHHLDHIEACVRDAYERGFADAVEKAAGENYLGLTAQNIARKILALKPDNKTPLSTKGQDT
jgi:hypothetical protein